MYEHKYIYSDSYFYLHDTCIVANNFPMNLDSIVVKENDIYKCLGQSSNIVLFHKKIFSNYQNQFAGNISKLDGYMLEGSITFGNVKILSPRIYVKDIDIYSTGWERKEFYYPNFEIKKYIFWFKSGDMTNDVYAYRPNIS